MRKPPRIPLLAASLLLSAVSVAGPALAAPAPVPHVRAPAPLPPFKDDLFAYPGILRSADKGDYKVIDYNEMRDINGRDIVPEKHVKDEYVSLKVRAFQKDITVQTAAGPVKPWPPASARAPPSSSSICTGAAATASRA